MNPGLKVLLVEDCENDAFLLVHELRRGGYEPFSERVYSSQAMRAALAAAQWDLILSDHSMPQFSASEALSICRASSIDVPFIIVSGRIGEEVAVELMKAGAHDYVRKDDLTRLIPAVNRELQSARERMHRRRAEAAMAHLASIVESCEDAIISKTLDGAILTWNSGAERIYGYRAEEVIGQPISILVPPGRSDELPRIVDRVVRGERMERIQAVRVRKDGGLVDVSITVSAIRDAEGAIRAASIVARDISRRKQEEEERLRLIGELSEALARVKTLSGLLPICSACKNIRNDDGYWERVETYIKQRSDAEFTHGICPDCVKRLYPEYIGGDAGADSGRHSTQRRRERRETRRENS